MEGRKEGRLSKRGGTAPSQASKRGLPCTRGAQAAIQVGLPSPSSKPVAPLQKAQREGERGVGGWVGWVQHPGNKKHPLKVCGGGGQGLGEHPPQKNIKIKNKKQPARPARGSTCTALGVARCWGGWWWWGAESGGVSAAGGGSEELGRDSPAPSHLLPSPASAAQQSPSASEPGAGPAGGRAQRCPLGGPASAGGPLGRGGGGAPHPPTFQRLQQPLDVHGSAPAQLSRGGNRAPRRRPPAPPAPSHTLRHAGDGGGGQRRGAPPGKASERASGQSERAERDRRSEHHLRRLPSHSLPPALQHGARHVVTTAHAHARRRPRARNTPPPHLPPAPASRSAARVRGEAGRAMREAQAGSSSGWSFGHALLRPAAYQRAYRARAREGGARRRRRQRRARSVGHALLPRAGGGAYAPPLSSRLPSSPQQPQVRVRGVESGGGWGGKEVGPSAYLRFSHAPSRVRGRGPFASAGLTVRGAHARESRAWAGGGKRCVRTPAGGVGHTLLARVGGGVRSPPPSSWPPARVRWKAERGRGERRGRPGLWLERRSRPLARAVGGAEHAS